MFVAARAHAAASAGLVLIAMIPHGHLPERRVGVARDPAARASIAGALCGALIGAVCGGAAPVGLADVLVARDASRARRCASCSIPRISCKLGAALRTRTTHLFEGIFEPAPPPPKAEPEPPRRPAEPPPTATPHAASRTTPPTTADDATTSNAREPIASSCARWRSRCWRRCCCGTCRSAASLLYPFKLLATWLHELSHGLAMIAHRRRLRLTC